MPRPLAEFQWFDLFRDDTLTGLVKTALKENFELRIAAQRVLQARAAYGITRAGQWPTVDASADLIAARSSQVGANRGIPAGTDTDVSYAQAGFSFGWELDVWGRLRRLSEAARAQYLATEEARRGVDHDARRRRQPDISRVARARSRAGDRQAHARCRHQ